MKRTMKLIKAWSILNKRYPHTLAYGLMSSRGYTWVSSIQKWVKVDEDDSKTPYTETECIFDNENAVNFGYISLPCNECGGEIFCMARRGIGLYNDNKKRDTIANFGTCSKCGKEHFSHIPYARAKKLGMI